MSSGDFLVASVAGRPKSLGHLGLIISSKVWCHFYRLLTYFILMSEVPDWLRPAPIRFQPLNKAKETTYLSDSEEEEEEAPGPTPTPAPGPKNIKAIVDSERVIIKYLIKLDLDKVPNKEERLTPLTAEVTCKMIFFF